MADFQNGELKAHVLGTKLTFESALTGNYTISTTGGEKIECKAVFQLLGEAVSGFRPSQAEKLTDIPEEKIREATRIIATIRPSCWYTWLGIEQTTNRIEIYSTTFREHGYEPSTRGANVTLLYSSENMNPLSGSLLVKGQPCTVRKIPKPEWAKT